MMDAGAATTASLHKRLLRLPRDEQRQIVAGLSARCRGDLAAYIQALQHRIDSGEEPELEPPAASNSEDSSASETLPSSPASSGQETSSRPNTASYMSKDVQQLFARARLVREKLEAAEDCRKSDYPTPDSIWSSSAPAAGCSDEHNATSSSDGLSSSGVDWCADLDSDIDLDSDGDSVDSGPPFRPTSFVMRALLRYLSEVSAETRKGAIRNLTHERRVELFAYMLSSEGRTICGDAFGEEELLEPDFANLEDHYLGDSGIFSGDTAPNRCNRDEAFSCEPDCQNRWESAFSEEGSLDALGSRPNSSIGQEMPKPGTPSKRQLVFRPRNAMPLGALQLKQLNSRVAATARSAGTPSAPSEPKKQLDRSGMDGPAVCDWLCGHISGPLCLARLLEGMQWARFSGHKDAKRLSSTEDLYCTSVASGYGGTLGGIVGGVARAFAADSGTHLGGLFSSLDGPRKALHQADSWVRSSAEDAAPEDRPGRRCFEHLEGLAEEDVNLTFRRRCIALHPHRNGGDLDEYLKAHVYLEVLRQWQEVGERPSMLSEHNENHTHFGFSDSQLADELQKEHPKIVEDGKGSDPDELRVKDDILSSHVLQLSWMKEKLEAELNFMRSRGAYATIGVGPEASDAELARAYKAQALRLHPDRGGSTEAFQALQSAYERVLKQRGGENKKKADDTSSQNTNSAPAHQTATGPEEASTCPEPFNEESKSSASDVGSTPQRGSQPEDAEVTASQSTAAKLEPSAAISSSQIEEGSQPEDAEVTASQTTASKPEPSVSASASCPDQGTSPVEQDDLADLMEPESEQDIVGSKGQRDGEEQEHRPVHAEFESTSEVTKEPQWVEGLDDHDPELDTEDLEKSLNAAAAAIPAEVTAGQAEMALQGAQMCFRATQLCARAAEVGPDAWPQLERLTSHVLEACQHVAEACGRISQFSGSVPGTVMPLLDAVSQRSACLRDSMVRQVIKGTQGLLQVTENISSLAKEVSLRQTTLVKHATAVLDTMHAMIGREVMATSVCQGIADVLETVARLAREAAEAGGAASMAVSEAQRHAENLVEVLGAAGLWEKMDAETKQEQTCKDKDHQGKRVTEDNGNSSDGEREPWEQHVEWTTLLQKLNGEVLALQQELRQLVNQDPALVPAVSFAQKEHIFSVVVELLTQARQAVSRVWYAQWAKNEASAQEHYPSAVEVALGFIFTASHWNQVAVPSIEARLLRLAALVDSGQLCAMLQEDVFQHALQLATKDQKRILEICFADVVQRMRTGYAGV